MVEKPFGIGDFFSFFFSKKCKGLMTIIYQRGVCSIIVGAANQKNFILALPVVFVTRFGIQSQFPGALGLGRRID